MDRIYRRIMLELLDAVVTGRLATAGWLPTVREISEERGCSPTVAREAVRGLEERGIVEAQRARGHLVLQEDRWDLLDRDVAASVLTRHPTRRLLRDAVQALQLVEMPAAALAAERVTAVDLTLLGSELRRMRTATGAAFITAESEFHRALLLIADNPFLSTMLQTLHPLLVAVRQRRVPGREHVVVALHERLLAGLREADPGAAALAVEDYGKHLAGSLRV